MAEEWTFVSHHKKKPKRRRNQSNEKKGSTCSGLYNAAVDGGLRQQQVVVSGDNDVGNNNPTKTNNEQQQQQQKERIKNDVLECLHALENQVLAGNGYAHRLITSIMTSSASTADADADDDADDDDQGGSTTRRGGSTMNQTEDTNHRMTGRRQRILHLREIVAYGIGNFATDRFQAPMLQLACMLLVRRFSATATTSAVDSIRHESANKESAHAIHNDNNINEAIHNDNNINEAKISSGQQKPTSFSDDSFEHEQRQVPIFYYEPCILPIEKELLESAFHVHVLDSNEMGKLTVESMREQQKPTKLSSSSATMSIQSTNSKGPPNAHTATLFYMPHCPMQLYCNVLWAHWDTHIFPPKNAIESAAAKQHLAALDTPPEYTSMSLPSNEQAFIPSISKSSSENYNNPIILFGNSFSSYEERTISSEKRLDPTNGVFRIVPFCREIPITPTPNNRTGEDMIIVDALRHLDVAFNDCNVISFPIESSSYYDVVVVDAAAGQDNIKNSDEKKKMGLVWPDRPKEWIASNDTAENEELK